MRMGGAQLSFDLIKINRHGTRQQRTLRMSRAGVANCKGKSIKWFFPHQDIYGLEKSPGTSCTFELKVVRRYAFEASNEIEANKIVQVFRELYGDLPGNHGISPSSSPNLRSLHRSQSDVVNNNNLSSWSSALVEDVSNGGPAAAPGSGGKKATTPTTGGVSVHDFELIKILGRGSFSRVVLVKKKDSDKQYAMKILLKTELKKRNQVEHTNAERKILSNYKHPFIVKLYYSFQTQDKLYMCLEYVNGGELFYHLKR